MKSLFITSFKELLTSRYLIWLCGTTLVVSLVFATYIGFSVRPSDLQLVTHYSAFGVTHLYRDQWYYLFAFGIFSLLVAVLHIVISVKLLRTKGASLAILYAWLGLAIIVFGWVVAARILNVWSPLS